MAKLAMKRIELIGKLEDSKALFDALQRKGTIEIEEYEDDRLIKLSTMGSTAQIDRMIDTAENARSILSKYSPYKKPFTDSFTSRREFSLSDFETKEKATDKILADCYEINSTYKSIADNRAAVIRWKTAQDALRPWANFDIPMNYKGSSATEAFIGTLPKEYTEEALKTALAEIDERLDCYEAEIVSADSALTCVALFCHKQQAGRMNAALRAIGFVKPSDPTRHPPRERYERLENDIQQALQEVEDNEEKLRKFEGFHQKIDFLIDFLTLKKEKYEALSKVGMGERFFVLTGYIPENRIEKTTRYLEERFDIAYTVTDPDYENENVPVVLKNNAFAGPVESITEMYSQPSNSDIDPNGVMAFFYYCFFGMMFSDAGYGLLMIGVLLFVLLKFKPEGKMRKNVQMYLYCGVSTTFWGVMYGSYFGDLINVIRINFLGKEALNLAIWLDPIEDLMTLLLYCFLFGMVHLFVGLAVKSVILWKKGAKLDAILDFFPTFFAVSGAAPLCAGLIIPIPPTVTTVAKYFAIAGLVLIILTAGRNAKGIFGKLGSGLYELYNTASGYLGDILSYSRLLALGLATGVIASVVNMIGTIPESKILKVILLIVVGLIGHTVNIGISLIGAYVHTSRLQYVEFFSRFYEGGGRTFSPLQANTKTFKFKEELNNG